MRLAVIDLTCDDIEPPACVTVRIRRAQKEHRCCECRRGIRPGARYEYVSGIWDSRAASYKTCLRCVAIRRALYSDCWIYGTLRQDLRDFADQASPTEKRALAKAVRAERQALSDPPAPRVSGT